MPTVLIVAQGLLDLYLKLQPEIIELIKSGQVSVEAQAALQTQVDAIRSGVAFQGPQWKVEQPPPGT